jgi:hypothetical protein
MNWSLLARIALGATIALGGYLVFPAAMCVKASTGGGEFAGDAPGAAWGSDQRASAARAEQEQLATGSGFIGRFLGAVPACLKDRPPTAPPWALFGCLGAFGAFVVLQLLARGAYARQVKRASRKTTAAQAVVASRRGGATGGSRAAMTTSASRVAMETGARSVAATGARAAVPSGSAPVAALPATPAAPAQGAVPRTDALDILSALDDEAAQGEWRREPSARMSKSTDRGEGHAPIHASLPISALSPSRPAAPTAAADVIPQGLESSLDSLGDMPAPSAAWDDWEKDAELSDILVQTTAAFDGPRSGGAVASGASNPSGDGLAIQMFNAPTRWKLGSDLELALAFSRGGSDLGEVVRIGLSLIDAETKVLPVWPGPVALGELLDAEAVLGLGRGIVRVPWPAIAAGLTGHGSKLAGARLRVSCEAGSQESVATSRVVDALTVQFTAPGGEPVEPTVVRLVDPSGTVVRAAVGGHAPGLLEAPMLAAGRYTIEFEDGTFVRSRAGTDSQRVSLDTDGVAMISAGMPAGAVRRTQVVPATVAWVDPAGGTEGDGSRERPFATLQAALSAFGNVDHVELRVLPGTSPPRDREGLAAGGAGQQWTAWWEGRSYDATTAWTEPLESSAFRDNVRLRDAALREDVRLEGRRDVRIVNAAYAALRQQAATDAELLRSLDEAYGRGPMVTLAAGPAPREPFRVEISGCVGVRLEGLRLLGEAGQSGVSIADSAHVSLVRCWVEAFEQGPSGRPGVFAPGRGVQVGNAGTEHDPIELLWCDIGWNDVRRPSMPVRGAALSVFASHVRLSRCYVHDNHASDKPGDITVDADSRLWGDATNHRANNTVTRR